MGSLPGDRLHRQRARCLKVALFRSRVHTAVHPGCRNSIYRRGPRTKQKPPTRIKAVPKGFGTRTTDRPVLYLPTGAVPSIARGAPNGGYFARSSPSVVTFSDRWSRRLEWVGAGRAGLAASRLLGWAGMRVNCAAMICLAGAPRRAAPGQAGTHTAAASPRAGHHDRKPDTAAGRGATYVIRIVLRSGYGSRDRTRGRKDAQGT